MDHYCPVKKAGARKKVPGWKEGAKKKVPGLTIGCLRRVNVRYVLERESGRQVKHSQC